MTAPILLNPGPVTLSDRVRRAMARGDLCHREPEFAELQRDVSARLIAVYESCAPRYVAVLLTASGTGAVEAMLTSLAPRASRTLVVANGAYGDRMATMLAAQGKPHEVIRSDWAEALDLEAVAQALRLDPSLTHVAAVHHETTTGRLNDIAGLGAICRAHGRRLLLDAVSSFGAEVIDWTGWNLLAVSATANKCLHGAPGISFVIVKRTAFEGSTSQAGSVYLDLFRHREAQEQGSPAFTPAVHVMMALQEALLELADAGGWSCRRQVYEQRSERIRSTLDTCGLRPVVTPTERASMLSAYWLPSSIPYTSVHAALRAAGFVVYPGQGALAGRIVRLAAMGEILSEDMDRLQSALRHVFGRNV